MKALHEINENQKANSCSNHNKTMGVLCGLYKRGVRKVCCLSLVLHQDFT